MEILVTICARQGSKGVKNKNIRPLLGKPLIAYTIEQALRWPRATDVIVSTDSSEIVETARQYGAKVPFMRPKELAQDGSGKLDVIRHALMECERMLEKQYRIIVDLDVTAPLRRVSDIENCYQMFIERKPLTLVTAVPARKSPYFNMVEMNGDGFLKLCKSSSNGIYRRQDAPPVYDMNASIYFYDRNFLLDSSRHHPVTERSVCYVMDGISAIDIDAEKDFKLIEFFVKEGHFKL